MVGMLHPENLMPIRDHDTAVELGRRGGKAMASKIKGWNRQQFCNSRCKFYDRCPAITTSLAMPTEIRKDGKKQHPCFIKVAPQEIQNLFKNLFDDGEEGLIRDILSVLFQLRMETLPKKDGRKPTAKDLKQVVDSACLVKKTIYGDKQKIEHTGEMRIIQAPELRRIMKELDTTNNNERTDDKTYIDTEEA